MTFHRGASDGQGYEFVVPRTAVRVAPGGAADTKPPADAATKAAPKAIGSNNFSFTVVPLSYAADGTTPLPRFWATADSSSGFSLTPTSISSVSYADNLVLSAIGTQVTDNRSTAIDAGVSLLGLVASAAGVGFAAGKVPDCDTAPLPMFILESLDPVEGAFAPGSTCWGYSLKQLHDEKDLDPNVRPVAATSADPGLPIGQKLQWFPYPACRQVMITIYSCDTNNTDKCVPVAKQNPTVQTLNVSTGTLYRRIPLPVKGKITFHSDFCGVDVTDDPSAIQSNWALLKQAISDYNNLKQSKGSNSSK